MITSPPDRTGTGEGYFGSRLSGGGPGGGVIAAGMANGVIKLFDARDGTRAVRTLREHESWIVNLHFAKVRSWHDEARAVASGSPFSWVSWHFPPS